MSQSPLGMRNNNPGNLRYFPTIQWKGQTGSNEGFCVFSTMQDGINASAKNLRNKQRIHGLNTIAQIIGSWAPTNENDTAAYINSVCQATGYDAGQQINLLDDTTLINMLEAIFTEEQGETPFTEDMLQQAAQGA